MRYYLYLDKDFLKKLYSSITDIDFSIDVIELFEENGYRINNSVNFDPGFESISDCHDPEKSMKSMQKNGARLGYSFSSGKDGRKSRRYINIQDVTEIKCLNFYHNLISKLLDKKASDEKVIITEGIIDLGGENENLKGKDKLNSHRVVKINDTFIFLDEEKLDISLNALCYSRSNIKVAGYLINPLFQGKYRMLKAIAIYIE